MDWRHVREILLSIDRGRYRDAEDAWEDITLRRGIGELLKNLERVDEVHIVDWASIVEWHQDGFAHWHIFIETEEEGSSGMIGVKRIKERWPFGLWVTESFIKSAEHWTNVTGYFDKHGYFERGKGYQGRLPDWALSRDKPIKRFQTKKSIPMKIRIKKVPCPESINGVIPRKPYRVILASCGAMCRITIEGPNFRSAEKIHIQYGIVKGWCAWKFIEGEGLVKMMSDDELESFTEAIIGAEETGRKGARLRPFPPLEEKRRMAST